MSERDSSEFPKRVSGGLALRRAGLSLAMAAALGLAGCSSVPDAVNPVEWYRGAKDWWNSDEKKKEEEKKAAEAKSVPGADKPFPKLDSVPQKPRVSTEADRKAAAERLAADNAQARYTDQQVRLQTDDRPAAPSSQRAAAPGAPPAPAPAPAPTAPVATSPMPAPPPMTAPAPAMPSAPPQMASAPPPMPTVSPPPTMTPPPMMPSTMMGQPMAGGTAQAPGGSVTFGAPPPDIAVMGGAAAVAPAPVFDAPPPQAMAMQPAAGFRSPRTPFSPRFPAGVQPSYNAPAMVGGPVGVTPQGTVPMVAGTPVATVQFGVGSSKIDASAQRAIRSAAAQQKASGGILHVIGHASSRTKNLSPMRHQMVNFRVSVDRANAVVRELMRAGVPAGAIQVTAVSDTEPVYYEVMPAGEAGNRRAVIVLQN